MSPSEQPEIPEELLKGVLSGGSAVHFVSWDRYTTLGAGSAPLRVFTEGRKPLFY